MRGTLVVIGSTGDVAPYLGVSRHLRDQGHDVTDGDTPELPGLGGGGRPGVQRAPTETRQMLTDELAAPDQAGRPSPLGGLAGRSDRLAHREHGCDADLGSRVEGSLQRVCESDPCAGPAPAAAALHLAAPSLIHESRSLSGPLNDALGRAVQAGMIKPVALDQPSWARRLHQLGVAVAPVPARKLSAATLAAANTQTTSSPDLRRRAASLAGQARRVRGLETLVAALRGPVRP